MSVIQVSSPLFLLFASSLLQPAETPVAVEDLSPPKLQRAVAIEQVAPEYTEEARLAGPQGAVILYLEINSTGQVEKTEVIQSLGMNTRPRLVTPDLRAS